jgi:hypothetical protein
MLFVAMLTFINYRYSFEDNFIKTETNSLYRFLEYVAMYGIAYGIAWLLVALFDRREKRLWSAKLWLMVLFAVVLFSGRAWFFRESYQISNLVPPDYQNITYKCVANLVGFVFLFIPAFVYWLFADRKEMPPYGFHAKGVDLKPYFGLILLMVPLLLWAGRQPDFLSMYPRCYYLHLPDTLPHRGWYTFLYELCYSWDYVVTEFFFRGFLILGFARYAGPKVILPMCAFYVTIHFDKPLGESISSFFGGYLLGILAYRTRSIYGGVIVHLGIALLMEVVGLMFHP